MFEKSINRLNYIVSTVPKILLEISEEKISIKNAPNKWSKKEIIGHLIDSATTNHQRFVRAQFEYIPDISYDQNKWNKFNFYQEMEFVQIINFWTIYNKQLIEILKRIPKENLTNQVRIGQNILTLEFLVIDYVAHLEHHLKQIIDY